VKGRLQVLARHSNVNGGSTVKIGIDMLYSQDATAYHGIGNFSFSHLAYLQQRSEIESADFCPLYRELNREQFVKQLTRFLVEHEIDILHLPSPMTVPYPDVFFSGELPKVRVTATVYDLIPLLYPHIYLPSPENRAHYQFYIDLIQQAHHLLAISEHTRQDLVRIGIPGNKISVISGGQDVTYYPLHNARIDGRLANLFPIQSPFLLAFNAVDFRKNAERLIQAFARAVHQRPEPWQLVFVNHNPAFSQQRLEQVAQEAGVRNLIHHIGRVDKAELLRLYNTAQAVVFPSLYEGLGLPVLEAMQCGTPVLTSSTSSLPEIVGDAAILVEPEDTSSITAGLSKLMSSQALRTRLGDLALQRAQSFDWHLAAERTVNAFHQIIQQVHVPSFAEQGYDLRKLVSEHTPVSSAPSQVELSPNRYRKLRHLRNNKLNVTYVSFNLAALPPGAMIQRAVLRIPVRTTRRGMRIHRIHRGWDISSILRRRPPIRPLPIFVLKPSRQRNQRTLIEWDCTVLARQWQSFQLHNHGLYFGQASVSEPTLHVTFQT